MIKKKPIPMPGFHEAVAALGDWSSRVGAVQVIPDHDDISGYHLKAVREDGVGVAMLRWNRPPRWHVVVGMGSWSLTPANHWSPEEMDLDTQTAIRCRIIFPVEPKDTTSQRPDSNQTTLALEP